MTDTNKVHAFSYTDQNLDELSISDLRDLHITLKAITDHLYAKLDTPRHWADDSHLNASGTLLGELCNYIDTFGYNVIKNIEARTPMTYGDICTRAEVLLPYYIVDSGLTVANIELAKVIDDLDRAEFCENSGMQYKPRGKAA
ncbi:hypothetical protein [Bartonella apis]|uniref:hypothetical protein n=1 Tax=Bartonella apis TaxID=1686310 RepID=UPI0025E9DD23|nr:hypothetical protein [uncultured Bartonella sp.]